MKKKYSNFLQEAFRIIFLDEPDFNKKIVLHIDSIRVYCNCRREFLVDKLFLEPNNYNLCKCRDIEYEVEHLSRQLYSNLFTTMTLYDLEPVKISRKKEWSHWN